jgi:4-diphosphocytidyl-2C-methyl-D-erythritol kinase
MSGSGSTFFVLSKNKNQIESIKYEINTRFPDYFTGIYNFIA